MKVALYARVSKDEDEKDNRYQNPENQLQTLREFCKLRDWEIVMEYVDKASGADPNRPAFRRALKEAWTKGYKAIVVWKFDRFSREPLFVAMSYIEHLKSQGTALISMTEPWLDTRKENPMSELVLAIMAWASAEERRKISERTKAGIKRLRAIGQWRGGRPRKRGAPKTTEKVTPRSKNERFSAEDSGETCCKHDDGLGHDLIDCGPCCTAPYHDEERHFCAKCGERIR